MKNSKKILLALLSGAMSISCVVGFAACGEPGEKGEQGVAGKSAYEIWLDNGHTGSETDFLAWLKGEQGDKGETGATGPQGPQGEQGKSAYDIWLENGHTGSEEDFLEWLKGETVVHTFGDWVLIEDETLSCDEKFAYHVCSTCKLVEVKQGILGHNFGDEYGYNYNYHWQV